jgi:alpha-L-rhamnosidase
MYSVIAGIDADPMQPGYQHILLRPQPGGGLSFARAAYQSLYGEIASDWEIEQSTMVWRVTVPPNTTATAWFPAADGATIEEGGRPLEEVEGIEKTTDGGYRLPAGKYVFRFTVESA